ncbi:hypothetical protein ATANTOWER_009110 [Ataeniobius toweri]|uniref:Uncharacterized protein n=1 Tax=Ataeniobius toweri TaxID=208326 RepID=A0ABU7ATC6_9TELE|nr:hypothetical protein [Ataeniobius toweri]
MSLDCGRKPEYPERTHHARGEHSNSMQKDPQPRIKPKTFLLQGNSATHCATVCGRLRFIENIYTGVSGINLPMGEVAVHTEKSSIMLCSGLTRVWALEPLFVGENTRYQFKIKFGNQKGLRTALVEKSPSILPETEIVMKFTS